MDTTLKSVKMLKEDLIVWSKCKWDDEKWIFGKLMRLIFKMKRLRNLQAGGVRNWLM